jgi:hypothetical protein
VEMNRRTVLPLPRRLRRVLHSGNDFPATHRARARGRDVKHQQKSQVQRDFRHQCSRTGNPSLRSRCCRLRGSGQHLRTTPCIGRVWICPARHTRQSSGRAVSMISPGQLRDTKTFSSRSATRELESHALHCTQLLDRVDVMKGLSERWRNCPSRALLAGLTARPQKMLAQVHRRRRNKDRR